MDRGSRHHPSNPPRINHRNNFSGLGHGWSNGWGVMLASTPSRPNPLQPYTSTGSQIFAFATFALVIALGFHQQITQSAAGYFQRFPIPHVIIARGPNIGRHLSRCRSAQLPYHRAGYISCRLHKADQLPRKERKRRRMISLQSPW